MFSNDCILSIRRRVDPGGSTVKNALCGMLGIDFSLLAFSHC